MFKYDIQCILVMEKKKYIYIYIYIHNSLLSKFEMIICGSFDICVKFDFFFIENSINIIEWTIKCTLICVTMENLNKSHIQLRPTIQIERLRPRIKIKINT